MNDIEAILKATIQTKVVEAFNSTPDMVEKLVAAALSKEVNQQGGAPGYHDKKMPYMDWLVGEEIRRAVCGCVRDYVAENKEQIAAKTRAAIESSDFGTPIAAALAGVLGQSHNWFVNLEIQPQP